MRVIIVGGGIIGLATGRLLARTGSEVVLLEKERELATHQTAHNSGVAHAGIYYAPGSLKARLCRRGIELLSGFCQENRLPYDACGKLVVATEPGELERLERLAERATANGVPGLRWLDQAQLTAVEPHVRGIAALHSPQTAILDFAAVARQMAEQLVAAGGEVRAESTVVRVRTDGSRPEVELDGGASLTGDHVIVCAGLFSDRLACASGEPAEPRIIPFRGEYWALRRERDELVHGLIYPVPDPALPFLGVHLTRKIDGSVLLGPNAVLSLSREGYRRGDMRVRDIKDTFTWPGTFRMMRRHWRAGAAELVRSLRKQLFIAEAQRYVPPLQAGDAVRAPAGVRAQAIDRDGSLVDDFRLSIRGRVAWVRNAPSPAATSSLAIAEELVERVVV
jgi:L-2-hydroxyglutarate oxidase LhgO